MGLTHPFYPVSFVGLLLSFPVIVSSCVIYMCVCGGVVWVYVYAQVSLWEDICPQRPERLLDLLELALRRAVSCHVGVSP